MATLDRKQVRKMLRDNDYTIYFSDSVKNGVSIKVGYRMLEERGKQYCEKLKELFKGYDNVEVRATTRVDMSCVPEMAVRVIVRDSVA